MNHVGATGYRNYYFGERRDADIVPGRDSTTGDSHNVIDQVFIIFYLKAHLHNGGLVVFSHWRVPSEGDRSLKGFAIGYSVDRIPQTEGQVSLPLDSIALLEAMAAGLPTVVSDVDGFAEVTTDATSSHVPRRNPSAAATEIEHLCHSTELRSRLGRAGRQRVVSEYDWDQNVDQMIVIYQGLVSQV